MQDNWPTAVETIALLVLAAVTLVILARYGALPWQGRDDDSDGD